MGCLGALIGLSVVGSALILPGWWSLLLIAGAWITGTLGSKSLTGGIAAGMVPFGGFFFATVVDEEFTSYAPIALAGFIAMGGLMLSVKSQEDRD